LDGSLEWINVMPYQLRGMQSEDSTISN
jgi:hypothetical protein